MPDLKMPEINSVSIAGRLTRDPELRYTNANKAFCKCGIAAGKRYRDANGDWKQKTAFVDFTLWEGAAEYLAEHAAKGDAVYIEGSLVQNEWEDKEGNKRSKVEINAQRIQTLAWPDKDREKAPNAEPAATPDKDDDIPF